jgi:eukaryotic-like serine/threonine-protein kinase
LGANDDDRARIVLPDGRGASAGFAGTDRYELRRWLGAGATGVVYEAFDRERKVRIALKTLRHVDPQAIYYLKREFRAIAELVHPNLVRLHELVSDGSHWFFTMDLIEGRDLLSYVGGAPEGPAGVGESRRFDLLRLRSALLQLATGIRALHAGGKLHRDIKPANVLVTDEGRVVLLDFGLILEPNAGDPYQTFERGLVGTPAYLAPEQAALPAQATEASDWYSVGTLMYEALTGQVPFLSYSGSLPELLAAKQNHEVPEPRTLCAGVPRDLNDLCMALLRTDPGARPRGDEIQRLLGGNSSELAAPRAGAVSHAVGMLVGREEQLAKLEEAYAICLRGRPVTVLIDGGSGAGKSALLESFVGRLVDRREAVVLSGRCFERELVPYRALDSLVDMLSRYLVALPKQEVEAVLPRDLPALARLFPVLRRVPLIGGAARRSELAPDPQELRQRAFGAMRDLLGRIADRKPLVMCIDDLQWGDLDSATLISHVLRPPASPPILVVACFRTEDAAQSACVKALLHAARGDDGVERRFIRVEALGEHDSRKLARTLLGDVSDTYGAAEIISRESAGNPLFLHQLAHHVRMQSPSERAAPAALVLTLDEVLQKRMAELPAAAHRLLEVLTVAGKPIALEIANEVAELAPGDRSAVSELRARRLARTKDGERTLEILHDRIRQSVVAHLAPDVMARYHQLLAAALDGRPGVDPEILASHFFGGGDLERASDCAAAAAENANQALAFERAARLFRWAIELGESRGYDVRAWQVKLGDALANLGRGAAAAEAYLAAARGAAPNDALEYRRRAAEQFLKSGHIDESMELLETILAAFGVRLARTPRRALVALALRRAFLKVRGLNFRERDISRVTARELTRLDVLWSLSAGFGVIDSIRATDLQARHLLLALKMGDPYRIARAYTFEAAFSATAGGRTHRRTARLVKKAEEIAERINQPYTHGWAVLAAGMVSFLEGDHRNGRVACDRAQEVFRSCTGVSHEINIARLFGVLCRFYLGEFHDLIERVPRLLKEAEDNGDLYLATTLRTGLSNSTWLALDDPETARAQVTEGMRRWTKRSFHNQHYFNMSAEAHIDLYRGDAASARTRVLADWPNLKSSLILRIQTARIFALGLRGRCTLSQAELSSGTERAALLRLVLRDAKLLLREQMPNSIPQAHLLRAGVNALRGDTETARSQLEQAVADFDRAEMMAYSSATRRSLGELLGGDEGRTLVERANAWHQAEMIRNPERFTAVFAPGFRDRG